MASGVAKTSARYLQGTSLRAAPLRCRTSMRSSTASFRFASGSSKGAKTGDTTATWRGVLAGAGLSLAAVLVSYRTGLITIAGDSAVAPADTPTYASHREVQQAVADLRALFPENAVSTDPDAVKTYGSSPNSYHPESPHSVVVHVGSTEDVVKVVDVARKYRVPVVAYSGATSLEGHFSGVRPYSGCLRV